MFAFGKMVDSRTVRRHQEVARGRENVSHSLEPSIVPGRPDAWQLSPAAFARLLAALDPDPDDAGRRYEELRRALQRFFEWRGAWDPDESVDVTIDRVARRIEAGEEVQSIPAYARGVARLVLREDQKRARRRGIPVEEGHAPTTFEPAVLRADDADVCLERCLAELGSASRDLLVRYYEEGGTARIDSRRVLAGELGIPASAVRSRVQRLRDRLEACVRGCLRARTGGGRHGSAPGSHHD
jgi:DNA-directed RNA polymerase specialized sigma24 family protein